MFFSVAGLSYRQATIALREQASFTDTQIFSAFESLQSMGIRQAAVLSTCNRSELYFIHETAEQAEAGRRFFASRLDENARRNLFFYTDDQALSYLFRVSAGLDSMVLGEDQILGQVGHALELSRACGACGKELGRIFQNAITAAKALKSQLHISEQPLSLCYIGVQQLGRLTSLTNKTALVVGSGKMAALSLRYLSQQGLSRIIVCNRSEAHAKALQSEIPGLEILPFAERWRAAAQSDIVVSATSSPHLIFRQAEMPVLSHPLIFLDLAIPRDVEPSLGHLPGVTLLDVDSLQDTSQANLKKRKALAEQGEQMLAQSVQDTLNWLAASRVDEGIGALQQACSQIEADTLSLLCDKLSLTGHDARLAQKILHAGFHRLQRQPILTLKGLRQPNEQEKYTQVLTALFDPSHTDEPR